MDSSIPSVGSLFFYALFGAIVLIMLAIDMASLRQRGDHPPGTRQALAWSGIWAGIAVAFGAGLWWWLARDPSFGPEMARQKSMEFFTGYVIEKALAIDNIFVFLLIFGYFGIPRAQQRRVLLYGVLGAIVLRALMVGLGAMLVAQFAWILYLFGAFLLFTGLKMLKGSESAPDPARNRTLSWLRNHLRVADDDGTERFFILRQGKLFVTPLFLCLSMIELSDVVFAVDSIPAIFAVTLDPFIVLTSNILAILGLRALYFLLADMIERFHRLQTGLALVLCYIGGKMLAAPWLHIPAGWSLSVVFALLGASVVASVYSRRPC